MKIKPLKAFTLIELLIVIIIIGILAVALVPRFTGAQTKARYARMDKDIRDFRTAVFMAQSNTKKPLKDITNNVCTACACANGVGVDLRVGTGGSMCRVRWISALRSVEQAAGMDSGSLSSMETDPWGNPYLLNENEGEYASSCNGMYADNFWSAGPNSTTNLRAEFTGDKIMVGDDVGYSIRPYGCDSGY